MKVRLGFVTNSSSSAFIISKNDLSEEQLSLLNDREKLYNYLYKELNPPDQTCVARGSWELCPSHDCQACPHWLCEFDAWGIWELGDTMVGWTCMDNCKLIELLNTCGFNITNYEAIGSGYSAALWLEQRGIRLWGDKNEDETGVRNE